MRLESIFILFELGMAGHSPHYPYTTYSIIHSPHYPYHIITPHNAPISHTSHHSHTPNSPHRCQKMRVLPSYCSHLRGFASHITLSSPHHTITCMPYHILSHHITYYMRAKAKNAQKYGKTLCIAIKIGQYPLVRENISL